MSEPIRYDPQSFNLKSLRELIAGLLVKDPPPRTIILHTGLGGMYTFDYALASESGVISCHMTKKHARLLYLVGMGLNSAVDENGIRWMIGRVKGKGYYFSNMKQKMPKTRRRFNRFNDWEVLLRFLSPNTEMPHLTKYSEANMEWAQERYQRHLRKKTGTNRTPISEAPYGRY